MVPNEHKFYGDILIRDKRVYAYDFMFYLTQLTVNFDIISRLTVNNRPNVQAIVHNMIRYDIVREYVFYVFSKSKNATFYVFSRPY